MHHLQDIILSIGNLIFAAALLPSIVSKHKPAILTSLMTAGVLFIFAGVYISLHLWLSTLFVLITGSFWITLAIQKYGQRIN